MDNSELIKRCLSQDARAWSEFVDRFSGLIYKVVKSKLAHYRYPYLDRDVDDIYQIVLSSIWSGGRLADVIEPETLPRYIIISSSSAAIDFMRRRKKDINIAKGLNEQTEWGQCVPVEADHAEDARTAVFEAIKRLKDRERAVIELNYLHDKTHKEIAIILNIPVNTVSTIARRTKDKIRRMLEKKKILKK